MTSIDPRVRAVVRPKRVAWPFPAPPSLVGAERFIAESLDQPTVWREPLCILSLAVPGRPDAPELLLDFGRELHGGVQLVAGNNSSHAPVPLRITFGESIAEAIGVPDQDHAIHSEITQLPWAGVHEFGRTGFRFVRLQLTSPGTFIALHGVHAVTVMRPALPVGAFECDDATVNAVYQTNVDTLHLCTQRYLWDGIERDRLVWAGDLHPEVMATLNVFDGHCIIPQTTDFAREDTPLPRWLNGMPTYSLWWVISLRDWWLYTGDSVCLRRSALYLRALMEQMAACVAAAGRETPRGRFLDWATFADPEAIAAGTHALMRIALTAGADLLQALGDDSARQSQDIADRVARHAPATVAISKPTPCASWPVWPMRRSSMKRVLLPPRSTISARFMATTYWNRGPSGATTAARSTCCAGIGAGCSLLGHRTSGNTATCLGWTKRHVQRGSTYTPSRDGRHLSRLRRALFQSIPTQPLSRMGHRTGGVAGAARARGNSLSTGFGRMRVRPGLGDLRWARRRVPTPRVPIEVEAERVRDGQVAVYVTVPDGVRREAAESCLV